MTTKNYERKTRYLDDCASDGSKYDNLNLGKFHQCFPFGNESKHSKAFTNFTSKNAKNYDINNFSKNQLQTKKNSWNKFNKVVTSEYSNFSQNESIKNKFKESQNLKAPKNNINNSTLSLHIAAYENSVEVASDTDIDLLNDKKDAKFGSKKLNDKNGKQSLPALISINRNPYEFPRQQENDENSWPEIAQFKASQRLFSPGSSLVTAINHIETNFYANLFFSLLWLKTFTRSVEKIS